MMTTALDREFYEQLVDLPFSIGRRLAGRDRPVPARSPSSSEPDGGQVFVVGGHEWVVRERASYATGNGHEVQEWECRSGHARAYLLREGGDQPRWLFAREVPPGSVALASGEAFTRWVARAGTSSTPAALVYRGVTYEFTTTSDGMYQDVEGYRTAKTTDEFWDAGRQGKLVVERWPDGSVECYHGRYVSPEAIQLRPASLREHFRSVGARLRAAAESVRIPQLAPVRPAMAIARSAHR